MELPCVLQDAADSGVDLALGKKKGILKISAEFKLEWRALDTQNMAQFTVKLTRIQGTCRRFLSATLTVFHLLSLQGL